MSLQIRLPLNGNLANYGLSNITVVSGTATYKAGKTGANALNLNSRVTISSEFLKGIQTFSICFWAMTEASSTITADWTDLIGFNDVSSGGTGGVFRWETCYTYNSPGIHWHDNGTNALVNGSHNHVNTRNTWTHCCVVFDKENNRIQSYDNGVLTQTHTPHANGKFNTNGQFYLGETNNIEGRLCDLRIYDHALSKKEVEEISKGLIIHYKLDGQNYDTTVNDNLLLGTSYTTADTTGLVANSSTDWNKYFRRYNGSNGIHSFANGIDTITMSTTGNIGIAFVRKATDIDLDTSSQYTLSCEAMCTKSGAQLAIGLSYYKTSNAWVWRGGSNPVAFTATNVWQTFTLTFTPDADTQYICYCFTTAQGASGGTDTLQIRHCKLEKGSAATPWVLNKSEALYGILDAIPRTKEYDMSGYGNDATFTDEEDNGSTKVSDSPRYKAGTHFSGSLTSLVITPCYPVGYDANQLSAGIWFKTNTLNSTAPNLISLGRNAFFRCRLNNGTTLWYYLGIGSTTASGSFTCKNMLDNTWHHAMFVFNNGVMTVYLDGEQVGTNNHSGTATYLHCNNANWVLAGYNSTTSERYVGDLSDFRVYANALTAAQVKELYNTPAAIDHDANVYAREVDEV